MRCAWCGGGLSASGCHCTDASRSRPARQCACCGAAYAPEDRFCSQCGASYVGRLAAEKAIERRQITFLFCDLVGSTSLSEGMDPEDYKDILLAYRDAINATMLEFGGWVDRFRGDGTLVYFGFPEAHEDDAERAMQAGLKSVQAISALKLLHGRRLQVRIGISTGLAVIADIEDPWERTAMGDAPNIAARLHGLAEPDSVVIDDASRRLVGNLFEFRDLGRVRLKGLSEPVQLWSVVAPRPVASRFDARQVSNLIPLIGREEERAVLSRSLRSARLGCGQIAVVSGEAGMGKSRLAASVLEEATEQGGPLEVYRYFCSPYRQGSPLHPCIRQLEHAAGFSAADSVAVKGEKLAAMLEDTPHEERMLITDLLNLPVSDPAAIATLTPHAKRRRTMQALVNLLERASQRAPVLLVFEDAQWADDSSIELLLLVSALVPRTPIFLLVLTRPDAFGALDGNQELTRITLAPLSRGLSAELVRAVAGDQALPRRTVDDVIARTDGIPLFIEELTRAMVDSQSRADPVMGTAETTTLPMLLRASLLPRLNRLGPAREVLEVAATIGREFPLQLLTLVLGPRDDLGALLDRLVASGLVLPHTGPDPVYSFKHALIRDAAYEILGRDLRRRLHANIAQALEENFPDTTANHPEVLAWHYTGAGSVEKAVAHWLMAGRIALRRSAMGEALNHLQRGLAAIAGSETSAWRLQNELALTICTGMAQIATQGYAAPTTGETFAKARALCELLGDPPPLLAVLHGLWTHSLLRADFPSAQMHAERILVRGEASGDPLWRMMGHRFTGVTCHPLGRFADAIQHLHAGLNLYDPAQRATYAAVTVDDPRVIMLTYLSWSQMCAGQLPEALRNSNDAVAEARQMGHIYTLAHALNGAAFVALTLLSPQAGLAKLDELAAATADSGIAYYGAVEMVFRGWCLAALGRYDEALPLLARAMPAYRKTQSVLYLSGFLRYSAEAHGWAGRVDLAMPMIEEAEAVMLATGQRFDEAETYRVRGGLLRAAGQERAANEALRRACAVAQKQGALYWELRASCALLEANPDADTTDTADRLRSILASYEDSLELPELRRARLLLARTPAQATAVET